MIATFKDLEKAARGGTVRSTVSPEAVMGKPAQLRSSQPRTSNAGFGAGGTAPRDSQWIPYEADSSTGLIGTSYGDPTKTYAQLLASTGTTGGSGKYAGFNTEGALTSAIRGGAMNFRTQVPANLRSAANQRFEQMNEILRPASKKIEKDLFGGTIGSYNKMENYRGALKDWYAQNAAPAQEYINTAQQIEATPVSSLASQIAASKYGQSADWAANQFKDLDTEYASYVRNQDYLDKYGITYDSYINQLTERDKIQAVTNEQANSQLEALTGLRGNFISTVTARTPSQLMTAVTEPVKYREPGEQYGEDEVDEDTGTNVINLARGFISDRKYQEAYDMAQSMEEQGYPDAAYVVYAMLKASGASEDLKNRLALSGIVTP